jgi:hypothetical protein
MKKAAILSGLICLAVNLGAYPNSDSSPTLLDRPEKELLDQDWLTTTSYFYNQLRVIRQTPVVPAVPLPTPEAGANSPLAREQSVGFGFQHDLNFDGKLDEFVPLQLPPLLGLSLHPAGAESAPMSSRIFSMALPSFQASVPNYQLWLEGLSASQEIQVNDVAARARGESGLAGEAEWRSQKPGPSKDATPAGHIARIPSLRPIWLALFLGGILFFVRGKSSRLSNFHSPAISDS